MKESDWWSRKAFAARLVVYFLAGAGGALTLLDSQARPSSRPSPVVAQLGTTYQTLSFSFDRFRASVTSCGFMAVFAVTHGQPSKRVLMKRASGAKPEPLGSTATCWNRGCDLCRLTSVDILLVGKDQQQAVLHFAVVDDSVQFRLGLLDSRAIRRVNDENKTLGSCARVMVSSAQLNHIKNRLPLEGGGA